MQTITVDMTPGFRQPTIHYSQNDVGTTFAIDLRSRFGDTLPASPTVKIQATKPSGFGFSIEADSVVDSVATFTTVATMTDEAGRFLAELEVSDSGVVLYTANFYMEGEANPHPIGTIDGSQETIIPTLTLLVERVEAAASSVLDMTVEAETLAAGSQATYSYDEDTNTATFGIPQGEAGAGAAGVTASAYSSSKTYAVGDYVIHNSNLYRCTTAITTAEAFTAAHWTQVVLGDDVCDLKSALNYIYDGYEKLSFTTVPNEYPKPDGTFPSYANWTRSDYIPVHEGDKILVFCPQLTADNVWYDENKSPLKKFTIAYGNPTTLAVPQGASYMVVSNAKNKFFTAIYSIVQDLATRRSVNGIGEEVNNLSDALFAMSGRMESSDFEWIDNSYVTEAGVITALNGWHRTDYIDVGDALKVYLSASSASATQTYNCWYDEDKNFITNFLCNSNTTEYIVPNGARYFILSTSNSNTVKWVEKTYSVEKLTSNIGFESDSVGVLNSLATSMEKEGFDWIDGSYVKDTTGEILPEETWHRTDYIDIEDAETIYLFASSASATQTYNCWYNASKGFISNFLCNSSITEYTPPQGAKYFILSTNKINTVTRGIKTTSVDAIKGNLGIGKDKPSFTYRGSLSANASYDTQIGIAPKIGFKFGLFASLSGAFDDITIQLDAYSPNQIIVDDTNVTLKYRFASDVVLPHGVTIADDIAVNVLMDNPSTIKVTVASKGVQNTVSGSFSITAYETLQILNGNQALSNLVITVGCTTVNHDVWVFGDSYLGMTNPARWAYYLNANDFTKNIMLCGSTGSGKAESDIWFDSFLTLGTPKKIVWCMGMNYSSDGSSSPSSGWLTQIQDVKGVCDANGIELILATIPTIPTKNHEQKNAYVRSSGLRYIDFARAVGAQSDGTWYSGMLSSDGVHPSETGAIALYNMAIASVPELTYDYR